MKLHTLKPAKGSTHSRRRLGRGPGSGLGGTSTRGHKGAMARSGYKKKIGFEGGQMPLARRLPKRGFDNAWKKVYTVINLCTIEDYFEEGEDVTMDALVAKGLVKKVEQYGLKVLGNGELTKKVTVKANKFTGSAKEKIEKIGGKAEVI